MALVEVELDGVELVVVDDWTVEVLVVVAVSGSAELHAVRPRTKKTVAARGAVKRERIIGLIRGLASGTAGELANEIRAIRNVNADDRQAVRHPQCFAAAEGRSDISLPAEQRHGQRVGGPDMLVSR